MQRIDVHLAVSDDVDLTDKYSVGDFIAEVVRDGLLGDEGYLLDITVGPLTLPQGVWVKPGQYHNVDGFHIGSTLGARIFAPTKAAAERIRARLKRGEEPRLEDFRA